MSDTQTAVVTRGPQQLIFVGTADQFIDTDLSVIAGATKAEKRMKDAEITSINMVMKYLDFSPLLNKPILRRFCGWKKTQLLDFDTREPLYENGEPIYGPAVILFDEETESMETNQATDLVRTIYQCNFKPGQGLEITYTGIERTKKGRNKMTFKIRTVD